jgi:serine/threonine protein kinase
MSEGLILWHVSDGFACLHAGPKNYATFWEADCSCCAHGVVAQAVTEAGRTVAIKALSLRSMRDWKQLDLFQREAQILKALDHPGIPR